MATTQEKIKMLSEAEWAALSLQETLSVEEAICDDADMRLMVETADMPVNQYDFSELTGVSDFDKFQFFNQDQIMGMDGDDLEDMFDPDNRGGAASLGTQAVNEEVATFDPSFSEDPSIKDNFEFADNDLPGTGDMDDAMKNVLTSKGTKESVDGQETPFGEGRVTSAASYMKMLLGEDAADGDGDAAPAVADTPVAVAAAVIDAPATDSQDNAYSDNNDTITDDGGEDDGFDLDDMDGDGDDDGNDDGDNVPDFDEAAFLRELDGMSIAPDDSTGSTIVAPDTSGEFGGGGEYGVDTDY